MQEISIEQKVIIAKSKVAAKPLDQVQCLAATSITEIAANAVGGRKTAAMDKGKGLATSLADKGENCTPTVIKLIR